MKVSSKSPITITLVIMLGIFPRSNSAVGNRTASSI